MPCTKWTKLFAWSAISFYMEHGFPIVQGCQNGKYGRRNTSSPWATWQRPSRNVFVTTRWLSVTLWLHIQRNSYKKSLVSWYVFERLVASAGVQIIFFQVLWSLQPPQPHDLRLQAPTIISIYTMMGYYPKHHISIFLFTSLSLHENPSRRSTRQTAVTYKPYNWFRESSTRQPRTPSCHTTGGHLSYGGDITYEDATQNGNSLRPTYNMTLPVFVIGSTTEFLVADVLLDVFKSMGRWSSDSFKRYWRSLGEIALKPCLELTSLLVNACKVTRSYLGVNLLHTICPQPWRFVKFFVHPSQVTM